MRILPNLSATSKPLGSRMGKGNGSHSIWICHVRIGQIICELSGINDFFAIKALLNAGTKLPLKTKVSRILY